jgi:hypothetical protein
METGMNELRLLDGRRPDHEIETEFLEEPESTGQEAALDVMLVMADADARWGDYRSAVRVLDSVTATGGTLPSDYQLRRTRWANIAGVRRRPGSLAA